MSQSATEVKSLLRAKVIALAKDLGNDARSLKDDQVIPETGFLDSAGLMELIMYYEQTFGLNIDQEDLTIENFGTLDAMAAYLEKARSN